MGTALAEIQNKGWKALIKELGYAGATKFILLYEAGEGDYSRERKKLFKNTHLDEIMETIARKSSKK